MFEVEELLQPISEESPCGEDLRLDASVESVYYKLRDCRNSARKEERQALVDPDNFDDIAEGWVELSELAVEALKTKTKDLEVAAWLIEALTRIQGFEGLIKGYQLAAELIKRYWEEGLYPVEDEDGLTTRVSPISGLNGYDGNGSLIMPIKSVAVTNTTHEDNYVIWQYEQALQIERIDDPEKRQKRLDSGAVTLNDITKSVSATNGQFYQQLDAEVKQSQEVYREFVEALDAVTEELPQPTSNIKNALEECQEAITYLAKDKLAEMVEVSDDESEEAEGETAKAPAANQAVQDRQQALNKLEEIAMFFRRTEPHSPISYMLNQTVKWSQLSLPELLQQLIPDHDARENYFKLSGIPVESED
ncbi:type VI secretion system protein TssA [Kangiella shandongensis]|uniref:type VI secretion system protein TssA n=1 Tax=Kangiella shandongensis TaxID=2763258 RepID=UPI001CBCFA34|nr:type VI secretion system protein TssA [Kangiella shandongensis]